VEPPPHILRAGGCTYYHFAPAREADFLCADDECRASCVDWYGNARPLFLRGHVFALLGYELVEDDAKRMKRQVGGGGRSAGRCRLWTAVKELRVAVRHRYLL
jgi:hypothetical protein